MQSAMFNFLSLPTLWSVTKPPGPRYPKNVGPQWGLFDLTGIQMSTELSLSISDFKSYLFQLCTEGAQREQILSFQTKREDQCAVCLCVSVMGTCQRLWTALTGVRTQLGPHSH